ncbi:MAG: glycosyltransferase family 4 protein [Spirochaetales bacterium]|jgi:glycosyltransferase involved in cell wall biosynthesis|nr:glycosyltransferase family 4 protein [Spirochaetales bacterium]
MHIAFIITRADSIGGAQIHVRDLAFRLAADGRRVTVLTGCEGDLTRMLAEKNIPFYIIKNLVRPIKPLRDFLAILAIRRLLKKLKPDIVSTHTAKAGMVGRIAAWSLGIPSIFTAHGWQFAEGISRTQRFFVENIERVTARMCKKIITVSEFDRNLAIERKVVKPEKLITIHNGMPDVPENLRASYVSKSQSPEESAEKPVRLIMVARFQAQKDHPTLLRALSEMSARSWRLELVGDGPDLEKTKAFAAELRVADRIDFSGQRLDIPERLAKADVFVLASKWEGFPRSILEAMRAGLPVIASEAGGCGESVEEGVTGYLVEKENISALRDRLEELAGSREKRRQMGRAGRGRFEEEFTFEVMYGKTVGVWREAGLKK